MNNNNKMPHSRLSDLVDSTLDDALKVVRECFGEGAVSQVVKALTNPALTDGVSAGELAYQDNEPVSFQIAYPRHVYIEEKKFFGLTAGCLALRKGYSASMLLDVVDGTMTHRLPCKLFFANTASKTTGKLNLLFGAKYGSDTFRYEAYGIVNKWRAIWYVFKRKLLQRNVPVRSRCIEWFDYSASEESSLIQRIKNFGEKRIDSFWKRYLKSNKGLVSSRTCEELNWAFGDKMKNGTAVALALVSGDTIEGYIVIAPSDSYGVDRWYIMDLIALDNDEQRLVALLKGAIKFLHDRTPCYILGVRGFPMWVQNLFGFFLTHKQMYNCNKSVYKILDESVAPLLGEDIFGKQNWFWGPFDGDYSYN